MSQIDHPQRYALNKELHARPFPQIKGPARVMYLAFQSNEANDVKRREVELAHLKDLLSRFSVDYPVPNATHFYANLGKVWLKWEQHTEFTSYTIIQDGAGTRSFDPSDYAALPPDWMEGIPGVRITASLVFVDKPCTVNKIIENVKTWFVPESLAVSTILDGSAVIASDFRLDTNGFTRLVVFPEKSVGQGRIGRIVQRLTEIDVYKTLSMIGYLSACELGHELGSLDAKLVTLAEELAEKETDSESYLHDILKIAGQLERATARSSYRFAATRAYAKLVGQRIEVLREAQFEGFQTFAEFMMRRFDPSMRTVEAVEQRLGDVSKRAIRNGELLRTRVDVQRQRQNQDLLESMNSRADAQLKLQKTVEGLSVVAISYYAVNVILYVLGPLPAALGLSKPLTGSIVTPMVILCVWLLIRRIHKGMQSGT